MAEGVFDVAVIGGGPGGYVAAIRARQLGLTTVLIERDKLGGRCLNYACIPAKAVLRSADLLSEVQDAASFGVQIDGAVSVDFATTAKRRDRVIRTMTSGVGALMKKNSVLVVDGEASFAAPSEAGVVDVNVSTAEGPRLVRAAHVVLATGTTAALPPVPGLAFGEHVVDTAGAWLGGELPASLAVLGAGASGVEVASAFGRLGVPVTLIEAETQILPSEEPAVAELLAKELGKQNVEVLAGTLVEAAAADADGVTLTIGGQQRQFAGVCIAAGRTPDLAALQIEQAGVSLADDGLVAIAEDQRTSNPQIFAIGDVVRGPALAHKASEEAVIAVETIGGWSGVHPMAVENIPRVTFSSPQVASIGMTEAQARAAGIDLKVGEFPLAANGAATLSAQRLGFIRVLGDAATGRIVGAHAVGAHVGDLIAELGVAKSAGLGYAQLARIIHAHPTLSEAVLEAARATDGWAVHA